MESFSLHIYSHLLKKLELSKFYGKKLRGSKTLKTACSKDHPIKKSERKKTFSYRYKIVIIPFKFYKCLSEN